MRGRGGNAEPLGIIQGDTIRNIMGEINTDSFRHHQMFDVAYGSGAFQVVRRSLKSHTQDGTDNAYYVSGFNFDASRVVPTALENRPVNMAVRKFIRALK